MYRTSFCRTVKMRTHEERNRMEFIRNRIHESGPRGFGLRGCNYNEIEIGEKDNDGAALSLPYSSSSPSSTSSSSSSSSSLTALIIQSTKTNKSTGLIFNERATERKHDKYHTVQREGEKRGGNLSITQFRFTSSIMPLTVSAVGLTRLHPSVESCGVLIRIAAFISVTV